jgi:hypothetical protein
MSINIRAIEDRIIGETCELRPDGRTTLCELTLDNDWNVRGESTCITPAEFTIEKGQHFARGEAMDKLVTSFAFMAREDAHRAARAEAESKPAALRDWLRERGAALDVLVKMIDFGPLLPDHIPSKAGRNELLAKGLAAQVVDTGGEYRYGATGKGVKAFCAIYGVSTLREAQEARQARRMQRERERGVINEVAARSAEVEAEPAPDFKLLVNRFLAWPLPKTVVADGCATDSSYPHPRSGTNLLNADEAEAMLRYVLGVPSSSGIEETARAINRSSPVFRSCSCGEPMCVHY